ncbi:MAG: Regulatory protein SoxS [Verrucomicrobiota bacterium]|jgi:AraC-like DNA-binding protein
MQRNRRLRVLSTEGLSATGEVIPLIAHVAEAEALPGYRWECATRKDFSWLLKISLDGCGVFERNGQTWEMSPGRAFFCAVNDPGVIYSIAPHSKSWRFLFCALTGHGCQGLAKMILEQRGAVFDCGVKTPLVHRLQTELAGRGELPRQANSQLVLDIFSALLNWPVPGGVRLSLSESAKQFIREHIQEPLTVQLVAAHLNISPEHLSRVFRMEVGMTCQQWLLEKRVDLACRMLRETDLPVKNLAGQMGMESKHFSTWFHQRTGFLPMAWRKRIAT